MLRSLSLQNACRNNQQFEEQMRVYKSVDMMDVCPFCWRLPNGTCVWQRWSHFSLNVYQLCMEQSANTKTGGRLPEGTKLLMSLETEQDISPKIWFKRACTNVFRLYGEKLETANHHHHQLQPLHPPWWW